MTRLTRKKDNYPCRIKECKAEKWMNSFSFYGYYLEHSPCRDCPFEEIVNKLGEYEDLEEERKVNRT